LVIGGVFVGMSVRRSTFENTFGPGLAAQYELGKRLFKSVRRSERSAFDTARVICILFGSLLIVTAIASLVALARGAR
jgi:hypothetical protein